MQFSDYISWEEEGYWSTLEMRTPGPGHTTHSEGVSAVYIGAPLHWHTTSVMVLGLEEDPL